MRSPKESPPAGRTGLALEVLEPRFGICRLSPDTELPVWAHGGQLSSISRTSEELSVVCEESLIPSHLRCERGWRAVKVLGPLDFSLIGVISSLAQPLTRAKISIFAISTFDTDYFLLREKNLAKAIEVLRRAGHLFDRKAKAWVPDTDREQRAKERADFATAPRKPEADGADEAAASPLRSLGRRGKELAEIASSRPDDGPREEADREGPDRRSEREPPAREPIAPGRRKRDDLRRDLDELEELARLEPPRLRQRSIPSPPESPVQPSSSEPSPSERSPAASPDSEPAPRTSEPRATRGDRSERPAAKARRERPDRDRDEDEGAVADGLFTGAIPQHPVETTDRSFADLGLSAPILRTITEVGFVHPTPVQAAVIPPAMDGKDVVGLAQTGSGKTAAFVLPLAEHLTHGSGIRGLILCPTREIALQTKAFLDIFGRDHELDTVSVIGGVKMGPQIEGFRREADILVATPGRLSDHLRRRNVSLKRIERLVLDEADHMLDLGFLPQIQEILEEIPSKHQTMMFSATMPPPIQRLMQRFMADPVFVDLRPSGKTAEGIEHRLYLVSEGDRKKCLMSLLKEIDGSTLVFVRRKLHTEWLARQIELSGFEVERIHSDRSQGQRVQALRGFREGDHRVLVATDVAARGLDIPGIRHVVNFGLPETVEDYVHRAGRTARGSALGIVSTIATWQDKVAVRDIEMAIGEEIPRFTAPGVEPYFELKPRKQVRRRRLL